MIGARRCVVEYEPDSELRDTEQVPLLEPGGIEAFIRREVLPHAADAWYDPTSVKTGYEISFTRYFYKPQPLRTCWRKSVPTSWRWRKRLKDCWMRLLEEPRFDALRS